MYDNAKRKKNNVDAYKFHVFMWPDCQFQASPIHDSRCTHSWNQNQTRPTDPRQGHAHFGHPVAIIFAMSDCMDNLEVAFQGDDYETHFLRHHSK